jgi:hypothetical protein
MDEGVELFEEFLSMDNRVDLTQVDTSDTSLKWGATYMVLYVLARGGTNGFFEEGHRIGGKSAQGISINYQLDSSNLGATRNRVDRDEWNPSNFYAEAQRRANAYVRARKSGVRGYHRVRPQRSNMFRSDLSEERRITRNV